MFLRYGQVVGLAGVLAAQAIPVAMYVIGFSEAFVASAPDRPVSHSSPIGYGNIRNDPINPYS